MARRRSLASTEAQYARATNAYMNRKLASRKMALVAG